MDADARFREKMAARAANRLPVFVDQPAVATGDSEEALDARFQAKLAARANQAAAQENPLATAPAKSAKTKPEPEKKAEPSGKA